MRLIGSDALRTLLEYDAVTGIFTWRVSRGRNKVGTVAGSLNSSGYLQIRIYGYKYYAHRLAWLYTYKTWPVSDLDHINKIKIDNRIINLREVTRSENQQNRVIPVTNKSGFRGVYWHKSVGKWCASIKLNNKNYHLGYYDTPEEASSVYEYAAKEKHTHRPVVTDDTQGLDLLQKAGIVTENFKGES